MSELLERDPEVQIIEAALGAAAAGDGRLVLVEAPAGLGKSTSPSLLWPSRPTTPDGPYPDEALPRTGEAH